MHQQIKDIAIDIKGNIYNTIVQTLDRCETDINKIKDLFLVLTSIGAEIVEYSVRSLIITGFLKKENLREILDGIFKSVEKNRQWCTGGPK